jgi:hypothetical protein
MKPKLNILSTCVFALLSVAAPLQAHHGYAAYDMTTKLTIKGTVTNFLLANPHSQIALNVKNPAGNVEHWIIEDSNTVRGMKAGGWTFDSLKPGDEVMIYYYPAKSGAHAGLIINLTFPDGRVLPVKGSGERVQ